MKNHRADRTIVLERGQSAKPWKGAGFGKKKKKKKKKKKTVQKGLGYKDFPHSLARSITDMIG